MTEYKEHLRGGVSVTWRWAEAHHSAKTASKNCGNFKKKVPQCQMDWMCHQRQCWCHPKNYNMWWNVLRDEAWSQSWLWEHSSLHHPQVQLKPSVMMIQKCLFQTDWSEVETVLRSDPSLKFFLKSMDAEIKRRPCGLLWYGGHWGNWHWPGCWSGLPAVLMAHCSPSSSWITETGRRCYTVLNVVTSNTKWAHISLYSGTFPHCVLLLCV